MKGSEFVQQMAKVPFKDLDAIMLRYLLDEKNVPDFLREDTKVGVDSRAVIDGKLYTATTFHKRNYLALGENDDYMLAPLSIVRLQEWCTQKGGHWYIPPKKLVKRVWDATDCKIRPQNIWRAKPGDGKNGHPGQISATGLAPNWDEQQMINDAMRNKGCPLTAFCRAKKAYNTAPDVGGTRLHFTGWYTDGVTGYAARDPGYPGSLAGEVGPQSKSYGYGLQDQSTTPQDVAAHDPLFADYSHGCDVVHYACLVNGMQYDFADLCQHPVLHVLVSDQGPFVPVFPNANLKPPSSGAPLPSAPAAPANFQGPVYKTTPSGVSLIKASTLPSEGGKSSLTSVSPSIVNVLIGFGVAVSGYFLLRRWSASRA